MSKQLLERITDMIASSIEDSRLFAAELVARGSAE